MKQAEALGGEHGLIHRHPRWAPVGNYLCPENRICHHRNVVRRPAEQEGHHHDHNHPHGSLPLKGPADVKEAPDGDSIAGQHDGQGDEKTQRMAEHPGGQPPLVGAVCFVLFAARQPTGVRRRARRTEEARQRQTRSDSPDGTAHPPADHLSVRPASIHGAHNHHVAVDADARQEEDAGVEAQLLEDGEDFAHGVPEHPAPHEGDGRERESDGEQEVGDCQVEEVEVGGRQRLIAEANHQPHDQVSRDGQQEDEDVERTDSNHDCIRGGEVAAGLRLRVEDEGLRVIVLVGEVEFVVNGGKVPHKRRSVWIWGEKPRLNVRQTWNDRYPAT